MPTSRTLARFVEHDATEENMRLLARYLEQDGRPLSFYTDKATLFANTPKTKRGDLAGKDRVPLPAQIGRALKELDMVWIAAHSPQAKGRVERGFGTTQYRLVKGLRVAHAKTLEEANAYLENEFLPWWNQTLTVRPGVADDAHRPLGKCRAARRHSAGDFSGFLGSSGLHRTDILRRKSRSQYTNRC
jgi:hypothetical protein